MTTVGNTKAQPTRTARPEKMKVPIKVEIEEPQPKTELSVDNGDRNKDPSMPKIKLKAKVTISGQEVTTGTVKWEFHITGTYPHRSSAGVQDRPYSFAAGSVETTPGQEKEYQLEPAQVVGGALSVSASFTAGADVGGATIKQTVAGCKVIGQDLDINESQAYIIAKAGTLSWCFLRLFAYETRAHPLQQFHNKMPWIGAPAGVGVVQRDVEPEKWDKVLKIEGGKTTTAPNKYFPSIFWNWKRCVDEGISFFNSEKLTLAQSDLTALKQDNPKLPDPLIGITYRAAIRRYNGGHEYDSDDGLHYQTPNNPAQYAYNVVRYTQPPLAPSYPVPPEALDEIWPVDPPKPKPAPKPAKH